MMRLMLHATTDMITGAMPVEMAAQVYNGLWKVAKIAALQHRFGEYERDSGDFVWNLVSEKDEDDVRPKELRRKK